jgi:hypothetical protein
MSGWGFEILTGPDVDALGRELLARPESDQPPAPTESGLRWWVEQWMSEWNRVQRPAMHSHWSW